MQVDDVGLAKFACRGDVDARVGNGHGEEVPTAQQVAQPNDESLVAESQEIANPLTHGNDRRMVAFLLAHHHRHLHAIVAQGFHQSVGRYGSAACQFAGINDENFHIGQQCRHKWQSAASDARFFLRAVGGELRCC